MIFVKTLIFCTISLFLLFSALPKADVFAQVITNGLEESDLYTQLSNKLDNTTGYVNNAIRAVESGENEEALNIISNITMNIKEIRNGLNLIVDNPIFGGD
jgi:Zn-dependent M16 (insulinase) family peptidase